MANNDPFGLVPPHDDDPTQVIWDAFIADIQTKDSGKKKSKKRAARDFKAEVMKKMKVRQNYSKLIMIIILINVVKRLRITIKY